MEKRKRGRPPVADKAKPRIFRLSEDAWETLFAIAARERLVHGGIPSRTAALRWLVEMELARTGVTTGGQRG